jgi:hypothetical protein
VLSRASSIYRAVSTVKIPSKPLTQANSMRERPVFTTATTALGFLFNENLLLDEQ